MRALILAAVGTLAASVAAADANVSLQRRAPDADGTFVVDVVLETNEDVSGFQNDLLFDDDVFELRTSDCQINRAIGVFPFGPPPATTCFEDVSIGPCKTLTSVVRRCFSDECPSALYDRVSLFRAIVI